MKFDLDVFRKKLTSVRRTNSEPWEVVFEEVAAIVNTMNHGLNSRVVLIENKEGNTWRMSLVNEIFRTTNNSKRTFDDLFSLALHVSGMSECFFATNQFLHNCHVIAMPFRDKDRTRAVVIMWRPMTTIISTFDTYGMKGVLECMGDDVKFLLEDIKHQRRIRAERRQRLFGNKKK